MPVKAMAKTEFPFPLEFVIDTLCNATHNGETSPKGELEVSCPHSTDKKRTFEINMRKGGTWKCYHNCPDCPLEKPAGGILHFYMLFHHCKSASEAHRAIIDAWENGGHAAPKREIRVSAAAPREQLNKASDEVLDKTYRALLDTLSLSDKHRNELKRRGMSDADIDSGLFRSAPQNGESSIAAALEAQGYVVDGVPGFYRSKGGEAKISIPRDNGFFIPYTNKDNLINYLQIRKDIEIPPGTDPEERKRLSGLRYRPFSTSYINTGAGATNPPFFGNQGKTFSGTKVFATEGGLKASVAESLSGKWFVSIIGAHDTGAWDTLLFGLRERGVTTIIEAFDMDRFDKPGVMKSIKEMCQTAKDRGFKVVHYEWDHRYKGVDDYLLAYSKGLTKASGKFYED